MKKQNLIITLKDLWYVCWQFKIFVILDGKPVEVLDGPDGPVVNGEYRCEDLVAEIRINDYPSYGRVMEVCLA